MNKRLKKENGITLVSLVVTIILLLILAGITISALSGENGLLEKAKQSGEKYAKAQAEEDIKLVLNEWKIEKISSNKTFVEFLDSKTESKEIDDYEVLEDGNIEIYKNGYVILVDLDGNILEGPQKAGAKPKISNISIKLEDGTEPTEYSQEVGTPLVISFDTEIEGGEITSIEPSVPYKTDGTELEKKFVVTGKVKNDYYTKTIMVNLKNKYKLKEPVITPSTTEWTNQDIIVEVDYGNIDSTYTKEISIDGGKTYNLYTGVVTIEKNTVIKARIMGQVEVKSELEITNIDKLEPKDFTPTVSDLVSSTELTVNANTTDADATDEYGSSGIKEYQYYIYKGTELVDKSEKITSTSWTATGLTVGNEYDIYVEVWDNAGKYRKSEILNYTKLEVYVWNYFNTEEIRSWKSESSGEDLWKGDGHATGYAKVPNYTRTNLENWKIDPETGEYEVESNSQGAVYPNAEKGDVILRDYSWSRR